MLAVIIGWLMLVNGGYIIISFDYHDPWSPGDSLAFLLPASSHLLPHAPMQHAAVITSACSCWSEAA